MFTVTVPFEMPLHRRCVIKYLYFFIFFLIYFYFIFKILKCKKTNIFFLASPSLFSAKKQWKESMWKIAGRFYMRSLTTTLKRLNKFKEIGDTLSIVPVSCHTAEFDPELGHSKKESSMAWHRDQVALDGSLIVTIGESTKSKLVWKRGAESHESHYCGHTFSVVGGIHSEFYDFSKENHHVFHRSVNLDNKFREIIVLRFKMHAKFNLNINATSVVKFVNIIKNIKWNGRNAS